MKKLLLLSSILIFSTTLIGQSYEMDEINGTTINTCSGTFYDSQLALFGGDPELYYNTGEDYTVTFCSGTAEVIRIDFDSLLAISEEMSGGLGDTLWAYDGTSTAGTPIAIYTGFYGTASLIGYSGCLTFRFKSESGFVAFGWEADISCITIPPSTLQPSCTNIGFDDGSFSGWYGTYGIALPPNRPGPSYGLPYQNPPNPPSIAAGPSGAPNPTYTPNVWGSTASPQLSITAGAGVDPFGGFPIVSPTGGTNSMMLGDGANGGWGGATIEQNFSVTAANATMVYSYALVIQDASAGNPHLTNEQPFFNIEVLDCAGDTVVCGAYHVVGGPGIPGFTHAGGGIYYKNWTDVFLDFTPFIGSCVTVKFTIGDCSLGAHWAYAYLDASCGAAEITGVPIICPNDSTTLYAPPGGAAYAWTPGGETTDSIVVSPSATANYTCTVTSVAGPTCTTLLNYQVDVHPPALVTVDSTTICNGEQATLTATPNSAGGSYLWAPGGDITPAINVFPTVTTPYTCTFTDVNGCEHDSIGLVTVNPLPTAIDQTPAALCEDVSGGGTASNVDLTALNSTIDGGTGTTISWFSNSTATTAVPSPSTATVSDNQVFYALVDDGNCFDTATVTYSITLLPNANAGVDDTVCVLNYNLNATPSTGTGLWSGPVGATFGNTSSPTSTVSMPTEGTYTFIWTEDNGGCTDADSVDITLLNPIVTTSIEDCVDSSVTVTVTNGLPQVNASLYTASNLLPVTAGFVNTTATHSGTIVINGLVDGDMYSFDLVDANGCVAIFTDGPFTGGPASNAGIDDTVCVLTYNLNATASVGIGSWTGPAGATFGNTASPTSSVSMATEGTYTFIWSEDNGGCIGTDSVDITLLNPIVTTAIEDCVDSSVTVTITNGLPQVNASLYTASNLLPVTAGFVNTTATHNGTVVINGLLDGDLFSFDLIDDNGCTATYTGGPFVGGPASNAGADDTACVLTYNLNATPSIGIGSWTGPAEITFNDNTSPTTLITASTPGIYQLIWSENNGGCIGYDTVNITFNILSIPNTPQNPTCYGANNGQIILAPQSSGGATTHSYLWGATANNQTTNPATNLAAGTYTVNVTDGFGCFIDSTFTLTEPPAFSYTTAVSNSNCNMPDGWAAVHNFTGGTGPYTYSWSINGSTKDTLFNVIPGVYTLTVTDAALPVGCDTTFEITVGNNPGFTASITNIVDATCNGYSDGSATANGSDPLVAYTYNWFDAGNQVTQTATGLDSNTYNVELTDPNTGCKDTVSVLIGHPTLVTVTSVPDTICFGQTASLTATAANGNPGSYSYNWNPGNFTGNPFTPAPTVTTTYTVIATDPIGCPSLPFNVDVVVSPPLVVTIDPSQAICIGEEVTFSAYGPINHEDPAALVYSWDNGLPNGATQNVSPTVTTTYTVTLDDGCTTVQPTAQITITVNPLPIIDFSVDDRNACESDAQLFTFNNVPGATDSILSWSFGDGTGITGLGSAFNPNVDTVTHVYPATSGVYDVSLTVSTTSAAGECTNTLIKTGYITIYPDPIANFTINPNPTSMLDPTVGFTDASSTVAQSINSWGWDIAGLDSSILQNPSYTFPEDVGQYLVTLSIRDNNGCESTITKTVIITGDYGLFVPNAFTPDSDNINEGFHPKGFGIANEDYSFYIFDRWGELIYETHVKFGAWDGHYKGTLVQNGVYVWKLNFKDINGENHSKVGRVSIVR